MKGESPISCTMIGPQKIAKLKRMYTAHTTVIPINSESGMFLSGFIISSVTHDKNDLQHIQLALLGLFVLQAHLKNT